ncbi:MAG: DsbA family protein [Polyangiales bacterium]
MSTNLLSRRQFGLVAVAAAAIVGCRTRSPRVPTRAAAKSSTTALGPDLQSEILDTEDGEIRIDSNDPQRGPRDATCVVVVFSDFQCPFCRDVAGALDQLRKDLPKQTRVVFKHRPLPTHPKSRAAAVASQVVFLESGSEAFWRFHDRCFAHPHDIDVNRLTAWAQDEGVKADAIVGRGPDAERIVGQHIALADRLGVHGTPRLYINSRRVAGAVPYEQIRDWVDDEV